MPQTDGRGACWDEVRVARLAELALVSERDVVASPEPPGKLYIATSPRFPARSSLLLSQRNELVDPVPRDATELLRPDSSPPHGGAHWLECP